MKRIRMQFAALALALLLPACASQSPAPQTPAEEPEPQTTLTGRIVSVQESTVLLAGQEDGGLYSLSLTASPGRWTARTLIRRIRPPPVSPAALWWAPCHHRL